ncbi:MAG TPA: hypothetical protein DIT05_01545 [Morganella sp. (in: Bacteria)]|nr:hypothetical protein [Morganella sp. (in: enterobacteria)]
MFGENGEVSIFWKRNIFLVSGLKAFVQFTLTCQADELTILLADNYADTERTYPSAVPATSRASLLSAEPLLLYLTGKGKLI